MLFGFLNFPKKPAEKEIFEKYFNSNCSNRLLAVFYARLIEK